MICELVGVVEWWKMSEDQMYDGGKGGEEIGWLMIIIIKKNNNNNNK